MPRSALGMDIQMFLQEAAATCDTSDLIHALHIAARARGMTEVAKQAGVTRASLYKSLSADGNPKFDTTNKIVHAMGCTITIQRPSTPAQ